MRRSSRRWPTAAEAPGVHERRHDPIVPRGRRARTPSARTPSARTPGARTPGARTPTAAAITNGVAFTGARPEAAVARWRLTCAVFGACGGEPLAARDPGEALP
jgi:hypothetical protein